MSDELQRKVYDCIWQARAAGDTQEAVNLAEEAVALADSHQHAELGYAARMMLIEATAFVGQSDKMLVAFAWCLAHADKESQSGKFKDHERSQLLWKYKWVMEHLLHFPAISKAQVAAAADDFEARLKNAGYNNRTALVARFAVLRKCGDLAEATRLYEEWRLLKRDDMADCEACETNHVVRFLIASGKHEEAIKTAARILKGRLKCATVPHSTFSILLRSMWLVRGPEETAELHARGYRLVRSNRDFIEEHADNVLYLLRAEKMDHAMTLLRRHFAWALETCNLDWQFDFLLATRAVFRQLHAQDRKTARLRVPEKDFPAARKTTVPVGPFLEWLDERINRIAAQFDARNGNDYFARMAALSDAER